MPFGAPRDIASQINVRIQYADGVNLYECVRSNPTNMVDPDGASALWSAWGAAGMPQVYLPAAAGYGLGQIWAFSQGFGPSTLAGVGDLWMRRWGGGWYKGEYGQWLVQDVAVEFWDDIVYYGAYLAGGPGKALAARFATVTVEKNIMDFVSAPLRIAAPAMLAAGLYAGVVDSVAWSGMSDMSGGSDPGEPWGGYFDW